jgi:hypothetical protein
MGMGTYRTCIGVVSHETRDIKFTCGILIIKIIITTTLQYLKSIREYYEMANAYTH